MQLLFGGAYIGALLNQLRGQAHRQLGRQLEVVQPECSTRPFARKGTRQRGEQVVLLCERLAQRRQSCFGLREGGFLQRQIVAIGIAGIELPLQDVEHLGVEFDDLIGGVDLGAQRRLGDSRAGNARRQCQIGRLDLKALIVGQRLQRLDLPAVEAPDVKRVRDHRLRGEQIEGLRRRAGRKRRRERRGRSLPRRIEIDLHQREEFALLRIDRFLRRTQRCDGRLQIGIVVDRLHHQRIEPRRAKQSPPFLRNVATRHKMLRPAVRRVAGRGPRLKRLQRITFGLGCSRHAKIRSDRAARQKAQGRESGRTRKRPPDRHTGHWKKLK